MSSSCDYTRLHCCLFLFLLYCKLLCPIPRIIPIADNSSSFKNTKLIFPLYAFTIDFSLTQHFLKDLKKNSLYALAFLPTIPHKLILSKIPTMCTMPNQTFIVYTSFTWPTSIRFCWSFSFWNTWLGFQNTENSWLDVDSVRFSM